MEMGSGSLGVSGASGSNDSLNGLKFGKKIYFEDVGGGGSSSKASLSPTPTSSAFTPASVAPAPPVPPVAPRKGRGVMQGGGQPHPPRCQVEGCKMDLTGAKPYYCRHKVCGMHSKAPKVIVAGLEQRFCQQCSRFHQLPEFDEGKRSCRRRLAGHNERRRKPPPGSLSSRYGRLPSSFYDSSRYGGFLMDFAYPRLPESTRDIWPTARTGNRVGGNEWLGTLESPPSSRVVGHGAHPYVHRTMGDALFANHEVPVSECLGVSDSSCALSLLSNQTWESTTTTTRNRATTISANSNFEGNQMAHHPAIAASFPSSSWGFKGQESGSNSHEIPREMMGLGQVMASTDDQFYGGELELALQGNKQCMDLGNGGRSYTPSGHLMHWSL